MFNPKFKLLWRHKKFDEFRADTPIVFNYSSYSFHSNPVVIDRHPRLENRKALPSDDPREHRDQDHGSARIGVGKTIPVY